MEYGSLKSELGKGKWIYSWHGKRYAGRNWTTQEQQHENLEFTDNFFQIAARHKVNSDISNQEVKETWHYMFVQERNRCEKYHVLYRVVLWVFKHVQFHCTSIHITNTRINQLLLFVPNVLSGFGHDTGLHLMMRALAGEGTCVCVCERERENMHVCERENMNVCVEYCSFTHTHNSEFSHCQSTVLSICAWWGLVLSRPYKTN